MGDIFGEYGLQIANRSAKIDNGNGGQRKTILGVTKIIGKFEWEKLIIA
jgi:hypothetical protein